jgi:hypothetical protein
VEGYLLFKALFAGLAYCVSHTTLNTFKGE